MTGRTIIISNDRLLADILAHFARKFGCAAVLICLSIAQLSCLEESDDSTLLLIDYSSEDSPVEFSKIRKTISDQRRTNCCFLFRGEALPKHVCGAEASLLNIRTMSLEQLDEALRAVYNGCLIRQEQNRYTECAGELVALIASGLTNGEIADRLTISAVHVQGARRKLMKELGVRSTPKLMAKILSLKT